MDSGSSALTSLVKYKLHIKIVFSFFDVGEVALTKLGEPGLCGEVTVESDTLKRPTQLAPVIEKWRMTLVRANNVVSSRLVISKRLC